MRNPTRAGGFGGRFRRGRSEGSRLRPASCRGNRADGARRPDLRSISVTLGGRHTADAVYDEEELGIVPVRSGKRNDGAVTGAFSGHITAEFTRRALRPRERRGRGRSWGGTASSDGQGTS